MKFTIALLVATSQAALTALTAWETYTAYDSTYDATITAASESI